MSFMNSKKPNRLTTPIPPFIGAWTFSKPTPELPSSPTITTRIWNIFSVKGTCFIAPSTTTIPSRSKTPSQPFTMSMAYCPMANTIRKNSRTRSSSTNPTIIISTTTPIPGTSPSNCTTLNSTSASSSESL